MLHPKYSSFTGMVAVIVEFASNGARPALQMEAPRGAKLGDVLRAVRTAVFTDEYTTGLDLAPATITLPTLTRADEETLMARSTDRMVYHDEHLWVESYRHAHLRNLDLEQTLPWYAEQVTVAMVPRQQLELRGVILTPTVR
jgi:hypothetical protein